MSLKLEGSATSDALNHAAEEQKEIAAKLESEKGDFLVMLMSLLFLNAYFLNLFLIVFRCMYRTHMAHSYLVVICTKYYFTCIFL